MFNKAVVVAATILTVAAGATVQVQAKPNVEVRRAVMFWLLDRNNDGAIDRTEIKALRATVFDAVDVNRDGSVTRKEFLDMVESFDSRRGTHGSRRDRERPPRDLGAEQSGQPYHLRAEHDDKLDNPGKKDFAAQNRSGAKPEERHVRAERRSDRIMRRLGITETDGLDKNDFVTTTPSLFERADQDGDGTLSKSEFAPASKHIGRLIIME